MTGEGNILSDAASERLAPVTYLPWVKQEPVKLEPAAPVEPAPAPPRAPTSTPASATGRSAPARRERPAQMTTVHRDAEAGDEADERDERIDRLVVSRLRRSALSVSEVRSVLAEHGLDDHEIDDWIERYERLGYLDDGRLAEQLVHSHSARRGRGSGAILHELARRGIDADIARSAVDDLDPETERTNALAVAERRARQLTGLDRQTAERRLSAFLQRRGYSSDVVREAVTAAITAAGS